MEKIFSSMKNRNKFQSYSNQLLVAMPSMRDAEFSRTVVYIAEHDAAGARGFVINRETGLRLNQVLERVRLKISEGAETGDAVFLGGPVHPESGFVLHEELSGRQYGASETVAPGIALTLSKDVLEDIARGKGPEKRLFLLGYAGWSAGQLENELARGSWFIAGEADSAMLFSVPGRDRYAKALENAGITERQLREAERFQGHA